MSRHRNVRSMNYSDEYDGYDDVYGHSVEDDYTISPSDAAFMYDRSSRQPQMSIYLKGEEDIAEEDELPLQSSADQQEGNIDKEKLAVCLQEVKNILCDTYTEQAIIKAVIEKNYDTAKAIDSLLNTTPFSKKELTDSPKPQRLTTLRSSERGGSDDVEENQNETSTHSSEVKNQKLDINNYLTTKYKRFNINFNRILINDIAAASVATEHKLTQHPLYTSYLSRTGYYLCMKYIEKPRIGKLLKYPLSNAITPFKFDVRSPDEVAPKKPCIIKKVEYKIKF